MFGLDPFSQPVAITEILLLLVLAAFIGWLIGRLVLTGRINSLRRSIAEKEAELVHCRQSKTAGRSPNTESTPTPIRNAPVVEAPPAFVHADPLLPAFSNDDTPELIDVDITTPIANSPVVEVSPATPAVQKADNSEAAVLTRIAARASEVNFDRIGRATAAEADDLKEIVGIGPFLERKLHSLGIYTFRQVGNFVKEDIDKINELIEFFTGRIERDNWVEQAKAFHERKYGKTN
jgi:predicted flap endonuclease-1-like 5' DNA nuclease